MSDQPQDEQATTDDDVQAHKYAQPDLEGGDDVDGHKYTQPDVEGDDDVEGHKFV